MTKETNAIVDRHMVERYRRYHGPMARPRPSANTKIAWTPTEQRVQRLLQRILKRLERCGVNVNLRNNGELTASKGNIEIDFAVREKLSRGRRPLTSFESKYNFSGHTDKYALFGTGSILVHIQADAPGCETLWLDRDDAPVEAEIDTIIMTIDVALESRRVQQIKREAETTARKERERQLEDKRREERRREEQWQRFIEYAMEWEAHDVAVRFLRAMRARNGDRRDVIEGRSADKWLARLQDQIDERDPLGPKKDAIRVIADLV